MELFWIWAASTAIAYLVGLRIRKRIRARRAVNDARREAFAAAVRRRQEIIDRFNACARRYQTVVRRARSPIGPRREPAVRFAGNALGLDGLDVAETVASALRSVLKRPLTLEDRDAIIRRDVEPSLELAESIVRLRVDVLAPTLRAHRDDAWAFLGEIRAVRRTLARAKPGANELARCDMLDETYCGQSADPFDAHLAAMMQAGLVLDLVRRSNFDLASSRHAKALFAAPLPRLVAVRGVIAEIAVTLEEIRPRYRDAVDGPFRSTSAVRTIDKGLAIAENSMRAQISLRTIAGDAGQPFMIRTPLTSQKPKGPPS